MKMKLFFVLIFAVATLGAVVATALPETRKEFPLTSVSDAESRIVGGAEAEPHSIPYQVGLALKIGDKTAWCGGSLISNQFVLTAAHCTEEAEKVTVYLGAHNIKDDAEVGQVRIEVPKENLIVHEKWSMATLQNDIALIKLSEPIEFNDFIQPVNLPKVSSSYPTYEGDYGIISGWGKDSDKATNVSPVLQVAKVPIVKQLKCNISYLFRIKDSHICAGALGVSTCQGDSGGPLAVEENDGSRTLIGITSFGIAFGCELGWPGVFTRVTSYLDWITTNTNIGRHN